LSKKWSKILASLRELWPIWPANEIKRKDNERGIPVAQKKIKLRVKIVKI